MIVLPRTLLERTVRTVFSGQAPVEFRDGPAHHNIFSSKDPQQHKEREKLVSVQTFNLTAWLSVSHLEI